MSIEHVESKSKEEIEEWLNEIIAQVTDVPLEEIDPQQPLTQFGIDSVGAVTLSGDLEDWLGFELPASIIYQLPTIDAISTQLAGKSAYE